MPESKTQARRTWLKTDFYNVRKQNWNRKQIKNSEKDLKKGLQNVQANLFYSNFEKRNEFLLRNSSQTIQGSAYTADIQAAAADKQTASRLLTVRPD